MRTHIQTDKNPQFHQNTWIRYATGSPTRQQITKNFDYALNSFGLIFLFFIDFVASTKYDNNMKAKQTI